MIETNTDAKLQLFTNRGNLYTIDVAAIKEQMEGCRQHHQFPAGRYGKGETVLTVSLPRPRPTAHGHPFGPGEAHRPGGIQHPQEQNSRLWLEGGRRALLIEPEDMGRPSLLLVTEKGMSIRFSKEEISLQGKTPRVWAASSWPLGINSCWPAG